MAVSDAQRRANERYRKESVRQVTVRFYPTEADIWERLRSQPNRSGYVKELIRRDMEARRG